LAIADVGLASTHFFCLPAYRWFVQPADTGAPRDDARRNRGRCGRCGRCGLSRRWGPWGPFSARAALFPVVAGQPGVAPPPAAGPARPPHSCTAAGSLRPMQGRAAVSTTPTGTRHATVWWPGWP